MRPARQRQEPLAGRRPQRRGCQRSGLLLFLSLLPLFLRLRPTGSARIGPRRSSRACPLQAPGSGRFGKTLGGVVRYLITGGAGFIGSHLADRLLEKGEKVVLLDNLSTGSMENIRHLKDSDRLDYHLDGIENRQVLAELVDDADVIVHLAAAVGVKLIVESPVRTIETNVNGTQMVLEAASKKKKLVLIASTSEVYG